MNERILKLREQAGLQPYYDAQEGQIEKFAELIVRECVEVIKWTPSQFPNDEYVKNITEHFGVEK